MSGVSGVDMADGKWLAWSMTVLFRCRIEKPLLEKANAVTKHLGTSTPEMFRVFVSEIARTGQVPVNLKSRDDLMDVKRRNEVLRGLDDTQDW